MTYVVSDFNNLSVLLNAATTFIFYLRFSSRYQRAAKLVITAIFCHSEHYRLVSTGKQNQILYSLVDQSPSVSKSKLSVMYNVSVTDQRKLTPHPILSKRTDRKLSEPSISQSLKTTLYPYRIVSVCGNYSSDSNIHIPDMRKRSAPLQRISKIVDYQPDRANSNVK